MKKKKAIITFILIGIAMGGCGKCTEPYYSVFLQNNSQYTLDLQWWFTYPDTTISFSKEMVGNKTSPGDKGYYYFTGEPADGWMEYYGVDTLSFFIFDHEVVTNYPWEEIQKEYKILQRYDLSLSDLKALRYELTYPPSTRMRYMKMYPPFEE